MFTDFLFRSTFWLVLFASCELGRNGNHSFKFSNFILLFYLIHFFFFFNFVFPGCSYSVTIHFSLFLTILYFSNVLFFYSQEIWNIFLSDPFRHLPFPPLNLMQHFSKLLFLKLLTCLFYKFFQNSVLWGKKLIILLLSILCILPIILVF